MKSKKPITLRDDGYDGMTVLLDGKPVVKLEIHSQFCDSAWFHIELLQKSKVEVRNKRGLESWNTGTATIG